MTAFTQAQTEAIACIGKPPQIIACAGSGETQVISQRIAAVPGQHGVDCRDAPAATSSGA